MLTACLCAVAPSAASADDGNSVPPDLELTASGTEQEPVGHYGGSLAYYATQDPDLSWEYTANSNVSFTCLIDGQPAPCSRSYHQICCPTAREWSRKLTPAPRPLARIACPRQRSGASTSRRRRRCPRPRPVPIQPYVPPGKALGYGPYTGWVPIPEDLANGAHTITVIASDEDGVDPTPPSVTAVYDIAAPGPPKILAAPPRSSTDPTPRFRFAGSDERKLYDTYNDPFSASLRRVDPPGPKIYNGTPLGNYLEWRGPFCPTIFRCIEVVWPVYSGYGEGGTTFGIRERLRPGLYEFAVSLRDTVGNESRPTRYRFRVLDWENG